MTAARWGEVKTILASLLETDPGQRAAAMDRLCGSDSELRSSVESLLALEQKAGALLDSAAAPGAQWRAEAPAPETIGPYRVVQEIGRGGMGVVYLGERADGQYRKQVAIKLITAAHPDGQTGRRFERERQILAQLEHPGIARLLDGGATAGGQPYFIMEYVDGLPLLEFCRRSTLGVGARLLLFLQIADAVGYAHRRLIVHRDLKPGNILVTAEGQAKLLDFGLGQMIGGQQPGDEITQAGPAPMTPAYASPEQIRGESYTVAGDVYSLGVILFELLAGRRPYAATTSYLDLARAICDDEAPPLADAVDAAAPNAAVLRRRLRGDLETIVAKAFEKDPHRRYPTVDEFAADLRRFLEGRPVAARKPTWRYRAARLAARHRIAVPAGALALLLIVGFAAFGWWEARRSERRFNQVRGLAHAVMFELYDAIAPLPGSTAARALLARRALQYLENLSQEAGYNRSLQREVGLGYERIGEVEGDLSQSSLGRVPASLESLRKGAGILERLAAGSPGDAGLRHDYLRAAVDLARAYGQAGQFDAEIAQARRTVGIAEVAAGAYPEDVAALSDMEAALAGLADALINEKRYPEAIVLRERVQSLARRVAALHDSRESERSLAVAEKRLGALYGVTGRMEDCRREYEMARSIDERRFARNPQDMRAGMDLSYDYSDLGWAAREMNRLDDALQFHRQALELRQQAAQADPQDFRAASAVAASMRKIGLVLKKMAKPRDALSELQQAAARYGELSRRPGADWATVSGLAETHQDIAETWTDLAQAHTTAAAQRRADYLAAAGEYEQARDLLAGLRDQGKLPKSEWPYVDGMASLAQKARRSGQ
jgi:non-specific serine/threonine protein kinase/serine/threonine-protein kinase